MIIIEIVIFEERGTGTPSLIQLIHVPFSFLSLLSSLSQKIPNNSEIERERERERKEKMREKTSSIGKNLFAKTNKIKRE